MELTFAAGRGSRMNKRDIRVIAGEIQKLLGEHGGALKPEEVVEAAKPKDSPLHPYFDWDAKEGHRKWLLFQAGQLLRSVDVIVELSNHRPPVSTRAFVTIRDGLGYRQIDLVLQNDDQRAQLLALAKRELWAFMGKYSALEELASIFEQIKKIAA